MAKVCKITKVEPIDDPEEVAECMRRLSGNWEIDAETVRTIGPENAKAINRSIMFVRDELPTLPYGPTLKVEPHQGAWGWCPGAASLEYGYRLNEEGLIEAEQYPLYLALPMYKKGHEAENLAHKADEVNTGFKPINTPTLESTPTHENGHNIMMRLTVLDANRKIQAGELTLPSDTMDITNRMFINDMWEDKQWEVIDEAMTAMGMDRKSMNSEEYERKVCEMASVISDYAASTNYGRDHRGRWNHCEIISEAIRKYQGNGMNSDKFTLAIVEQVKQMSERFKVSASPRASMIQNGLPLSEKMFKGEQYNFPKNVKTDKQKAEWLDKQRQNNPYIEKTVKKKVKKEESEPFDFPTFKEARKTADEEGIELIEDTVEDLVVDLYLIDEGEAEITISVPAKNKKGWRAKKVKIDRDSDPLIKELMDIYDSQKENFIIEDGRFEDGDIDWSLVPREQREKIYAEIRKIQSGEIDIDSDDSERKALRWLFQRDDENELPMTLPVPEVTENQASFADLPQTRVKTETVEVKPKNVKPFTEEEYRKANTWDTFFQQEARNYDPNCKTSMPDVLAEKNGVFQENLANHASEELIKKIEAASVHGFDNDLATMALSRNFNDIAESMNNFIVKSINEQAAELAKKLPGGATEENLNKARATLWNDSAVRQSTIQLFSNLCPTAGIKDIVNMVNEMFSTQARGFANAGISLGTSALRNEAENLYGEIDKSNKQAIKKGKSEAKRREREGWLGDATQVVSYKENGKDVYVVVDDPIVADCIKKPNNFKNTGVAWEALVQTANFIARAYRLGTTGINPIALVINVLRDPVQAVIQGGFNPFAMTLSPEAFYRTLRGYGLDDETIKTVTKQIQTWAGASGLTAEMRNMGMETPGTIGYRNKVEKFSNKLNKIGKSKILERAEAPMEMWESMFRNQIGQQSFIKNYARTGDVNKAMGAAMFDASNSTTNFSHAIGHFQRATATVPYLSSAINGVASFWRQFNIDPIGMMVRITAGFVVPVMAITAWNLGNEERKETYMDIPEWFRDGHLILIGEDNKMLAVPIPEELAQFSGTARRLIEFSEKVNPSSIPTILARGAFGFLPMDVDGFFRPDGSIDVEQGVAQLVNGIMPQAAVAIYEFVAEKDLFTGQDLSGYSDFQKWLNLGTNLLGTGFKQTVNDIGSMVGMPKDMLIGKGTADTLARDLFGMGFNDSLNQFMNIVGSPAKFTEDGKEIKASGLFAENEKIQRQLKEIDKKIAQSSGDEREKLKEERQKVVDDFTTRVANLTHNYMQLYTMTGGLEDWQKEKIVQILTLANGSGSASDGTYQDEATNEAYRNERSLAMQRYVAAGLPANASKQTILDGEKSIALQAALNQFYGAPKQAATDFNNAVKETGLKAIYNKFHDLIDEIYDTAEANGTKPDYEQIEKLQAQYLQSLDSVIVPIVQKYGIKILNNNDFINGVRKWVSGMIPSDDWTQSNKNAKRFLSTKEYPLASADVKKWLIQRYSSNMEDRNIASDPEVTDTLESIRADIDSGRQGAAQGKIQDLLKGIQASQYYISSQDYQTLSEYNNMIK